MTEFLSERMGRVERALRDLTFANRQLTDLLLHALRGGSSIGGVSPEPSSRPDTPKSRPCAASAILQTLADAAAPTTPPPWETPHQGIGPRLQGYIERKREEAYRSEGPGLRLRLNHDDL